MFMNSFIIAAINFIYSLAELIQFLQKIRKKKQGKIESDEEKPEEDVKLESLSSVVSKEKVGNQYQNFRRKPENHKTRLPTLNDHSPGNMSQPEEFEDSHENLQIGEERLDFN